MAPSRPPPPRQALPARTTDATSDEVPGVRPDGSPGEPSDERTSALRPTVDAAHDATADESRRAARRSSRSWRRWRSNGERIGITALAAALVAGVLWLTYQFVEPAPPDTLRIASGSPQGAYHAFALELAEQFAAEGITLEVVETAGSIDNLARLDAGEVDIAFVQSGLADSADYPRLEGLASLYFEPLWIFSTREPRPERIVDLRGLRVAVGPEGSGTRRVALQLLEANGLANEPGSGDPADGDPAFDALTLEPLTETTAADALLAGEIDAALTISSADASMVRALLGADGVTLMDFTRAEAYARRYPFFTSLTLPAAVIDLERDIPSRDISLVAAAATLVARGNLHPALADLAMQGAGRVFERTTLFSAAARFPSPDFVDFPLSDEAERYYKYGTHLSCNATCRSGRPT